MPDNRNRPAGNGAAPKHFTGAESILQPDPDIDLINCTPAEFIAWLSGYRAGIWQGTAAEIARREAEDRAVYLMAVKTVHRMAEIPTHDELERRRRDYGRPA